MKKDLNKRLRELREGNAYIKEFDRKEFEKIIIPESVNAVFLWDDFDKCTKQPNIAFFHKRLDSENFYVINELGIKKFKELLLEKIEYEKILKAKQTNRINA